MAEFFIVKDCFQVYLVEIGKLELFLNEFYEEQRKTLEIKRITLTDWCEV